MKKRYSLIILILLTAIILYITYYHRLDIITPFYNQSTPPFATTTQPAPDLAPLPINLIDEEIEPDLPSTQPITPEETISEPITTDNSLPTPPLALTKAVIVPLSGVILYEDSNEIAKKIGVARVSRYTITHFKNPADALFTALGTIAIQMDPTPETVKPLMYNGHQMPYSFIELQKGLINHETIEIRLNNFFEELYEQGFFKSSLEYEIVQKIIETTLNPSSFSEISKINQDVVDTLRELKEQGYHLVIAANTSHELFNAIKQAYPELIALFDGVLLSAQIGALKNEDIFFEQLKNSLGIDFTQSITIESDEHALAMASRYGITIVPFTNAKQLKSTLKKMGLK